MIVNELIESLVAEASINALHYSESVRIYVFQQVYVLVSRTISAQNIEPPHQQVYYKQIYSH